MMKKLDVSSATLHILGMLFMLLDHMWATITPSQSWMTCVGRIAFPIFAFLLVEGYYHTRNLKKYMMRMLIGAVISEIPFNLMGNGEIFFPYHQNVMWTFLLALCVMACIDKVKATGSPWKYYAAAVGFSLLGVILGFVCYVDYYGMGIATVLVFYFFRGKKWWCYLGQFAFLYWINMEALGGFYYPVTIFGMYFELIQQGFALLALIPIWLYNGRQGHHSKAFQYFCYGFYPGHILILAIAMLLKF